MKRLDSSPSRHDRTQGDLRAKTLWLLFAGAVLLAFRLASRELWTHEGRWAEICREMLLSGDYFHPRLLQEPYYDKPLLSYWLMCGCARILGGLDEWALRLPSVLAGLLTLGCSARMGWKLRGPAMGVLAGWILLTTFYFVFWSRVASADMLNVAGTTAAVAWFLERRHRPTFTTYAVLFAILGITCLLKGLIAAVVAALVILPLVAREGRWRAHLRPALLWGALPGLALYLSPFWISAATGEGGVSEGGLTMVFRENILRFFQPFDHRGHVWTYLEYFPIYLLPWAVFLPPVVQRAVRRWRDLDPAARWPLLGSLLILVILSASGSRRSYYVLPVLPYAALAIADWILDESTGRARRLAMARWIGVGSWVVLLAWFGVLQPALRSPGGLRKLAPEVRRRAEEQAPLGAWEALLYRVPNAASYYLSPSRPGRNLVLFSEEDAARLRAFLLEHPLTMIVTERGHIPEVEGYLRDPIVLEEPSNLPELLSFTRRPDRDVVVLLPAARYRPEDGPG